MPSITVKLDGVMEKYADQLRSLGSAAPAIMTTALMTAAPRMETAIEGALTPQTGLQAGTIARAVTSKGGALSLTFRTQGGNVRLKFFGAAEAGSGVTAHPRNVNTFYAGAWIKSGFGNRFPSPKLHGQVYRRAGKKRHPIVAVKSGVFIPDEMVQGQTLAAWETSQAGILEAVEAKIGALLP